MPSAPSVSINTEFQGQFHLCAPVGWLNDPNGLSWFAGRLHLFYQYHPYSSVWGPMHWGHAVTEDLVRWTHLPIALIPGEPYDADGCFSGGAVADGERHALLYTGHVDPDPLDPSRRVETQCLAWGDGTVYHKAPQNPVIGPELLPEGASRGDFRDPKVWKEGLHWYCLVASRHADGHGQILLFTAETPTQWRLVGPVLQSRGRLGGMWECPDLFVLDGREVLLWSVMGQPQQDGGFQNPSAVVWSVGTLDRTTGAFLPDAIQEVDQGPDFYAAQTTTLPDGRVVLVGWMQMWERSIPTDELGHGWAGRMTLVREVYWHRGRLAQRPVRELEAYRREEVTGAATFEGRHEFSGVEGQALDLEVEFRSWKGQSVGLSVFASETEETRLTWEPQSGWLTLDRSRSGVPIASRSATHPDCQVYRARVEAPEGVLSLRLVLDRSAVEVFAQNGTTTLSATVYPRPTSARVAFLSEGGTTEVVCRAWPLALV
nr:invertase [uncultured bacterium]